MTKKQAYIICAIIIMVGVLFFVHRNSKTLDLPNSIGDPLELLVVKDENLGKDFQNVIKSLLKLDIGPSPQKETMLNILEVDKKNFTGIFKRHQNILVFLKSDQFSIKFKKDVYAKDQMVIVVQSPSMVLLNNNKNKISSISREIYLLEADRLIRSFKLNENKILKKQIKETHHINTSLPNGFFLAHSDSLITWARRETPKISQGVFVYNTSKLDSVFVWDDNKMKKYIDSVIFGHILGPIDNSYMCTEKVALVKKDSIKLKDGFAIKIQSLWRMENDFMGGVFMAYLINRPSGLSPLLIYTYLYAPGQKKNISLLQLESIVRGSNILK